MSESSGFIVMCILGLAVVFSCYIAFRSLNADASSQNYSVLEYTSPYSSCVFAERNSKCEVISIDMGTQICVINRHEGGVDCFPKQ